MSSANKRFVFRPLPVILTVLATGLSLLLGFLQIGLWINENAVWSLWAATAALFVVVLLLVARLEGVRGAAQSEVDAARLKVEHAVTHLEEAKVALRAYKSATQRPAGLGKFDQDLADRLYAYASDPQVLMTLGSFFPYQIPRDTVCAIEELGELPVTRAAHDAELSEHLGALVGTAQQWRSKLLPLITIEGDHFTTRLMRDVPQAAYEQHSAMTDELGDVGFDLHKKLLAYQKYYASL